jgi:hypothetical protein
MHNRLIIIAVLAGFVVAPALAQSNSLTGFHVLNLEPSARAAALAGSFGAIYGDDVNAVFYNPALLNDEMDRSFSVSYLNHLADINAGFASYARTFENYGTFSAGLRFISYGNFERFDENGAAEGGSFGASEAVLSVSYARPIAERFRAGGSLKLIYAGIDDASAQAVAADMGIVYHLPDQRFTASASLHNLGFVASSLGSTDDSLPVDLRIGVAKRLTYLPLLVTVTGHNLTSFDSGNGFFDEALQHVAVGSELQLGQAVALRAGYNHRTHEALKSRSRLDLAGVGLGFGLNVRGIGFDYAYNSWSSFGGLHHLTLRTRL